LGKNIYRLSIENAFYFSFAAFILVWLAGFLYEYLEKTTGRISLGSLILILLSLILTLFLLSLANILWGTNHGKEVDLFMKISAIFLFALLSSIILVALIAFFMYKV
jgi:hypothetical protein